MLIDRLTHGLVLITALFILVGGIIEMIYIVSG